MLVTNAMSFCRGAGYKIVIQKGWKEMRLVDVSDDRFALLQPGFKELMKEEAQWISYHDGWAYIRVVDYGEETEN